jgi:tetratricopeptide (TPR) repeat protein
VILIIFATKKFCMKALNFYIRYRLWLGLLLLGVAIFTNMEAGFWPAFIIYLLAVISILGHFLLGPMRLIQSAMEQGDMVEAQRIVKSIRFPGLLIKPIRSVYFTIQGNLAMANQDYAKAEDLMKKGLSLSGSLTQQAEGPSKLQLGMLSIQRGDTKQGEAYIRQAIRAGLPDDDNYAAAYLQLCSIMMNKREFRAAKEFFRKAKSYKPVTPQLIDQIKQIEKYIGRMPG